MGDFNAGGAINALAGIAKASEKLPTYPAPSQGMPAAMRQRSASEPAPKPAAQAPRGAVTGVAQQGLHREDRAYGQASGEHARPTKAPLQTRSASPAAYATSGIEQAMGELADRLHKPVHRYAKAQATRRK